MNNKFLINKKMFFVKNGKSFDNFVKEVEKTKNISKSEKEELLDKEIDRINKNLEVLNWRNKK